MDNIVTLKLPRNFVGQLLDCLDVNIEDWQRTINYLEDGYFDPDDPYIRECSNSDEAGKIEAFYREIKSDIEKQLA